MAVDRLLGMAEDSGEKLRGIPLQVCHGSMERFSGMR